MKYLYIINFLCFNLFATHNIITLKDALNLAKEHNVAYKQAQAQLSYKTNIEWLKVSKLLPDLSFNSSHPLRGFADSHKAAFLFTMPLLDIKSLINIKAGSEKLKAERFGLKYKYEELLYRVAKLYIETLRMDAERELSKKEYEKFLHYDQISKRMDKNDLDKALADYYTHKSHSDYILKEEEYEQKRRELAFEIGVTDYFNINLFSLESNIFSLNTKDLENLSNNNFNIQELKTNIISSNYNLASEAFFFMPVLKLDMNSHWPLHKKPASFNNEIMLNLEIPLFSGGTTFAQHRAHKAQLLINQLKLKEKEGHNTQTIENLLNNNKALKEALQSSTKAYEAAQKAAFSADRLLRHNALTAQSFIDAYMPLFSAQSDKQKITIEILHNKLELLFITGKIEELINNAL